MNSRVLVTCVEVRRVIQHQWVMLTTCAASALTTTVALAAPLLLTIHPRDLEYRVRLAAAVRVEHDRVTLPLTLALTLPLATLSRLALTLLALALTLTLPLTLALPLLALALALLALALPLLSLALALLPLLALALPLLALLTLLTRHHNTGTALAACTEGKPPKTLASPLTLTLSVLAILPVLTLLTLLRAANHLAQLLHLLLELLTLLLAHLFSRGAVQLFGEATHLLAHLALLACVAIERFGGVFHFATKSLKLAPLVFDVLALTLKPLELPLLAPQKPLLLR